MGTGWGPVNQTPTKGEVMLRIRRPSPTLVIACTALFVALGGAAYAATTIPNGSITHSKLADNSVWHNNIKSGAVQQDSLSPGVQSQLQRAGQPGPQGPRGFRGPKGVSGFQGAFYSVQNYTEQITNGAIATAACDPTNDTRSQKFVAISGGVQDTDKNTNMTTNPNPLPLAASFPGRMDYSTFTPKPGRLDGWIVQFSQGSTQGSADTNLVVWALCVPQSDFGTGGIPVVTNG